MERLGGGEPGPVGLVLAPLHFGLPAMKRFGGLTSAFEAAGARVHGDRYWHLFILGVAPVGV